MRPIARTTYALRPLLSFLIPEAQDRVLERVTLATLQCGVLSASGCAGDAVLWTADGRGVGVSHLPAGAVVYVGLESGPAGTIRVQEHTTDAAGIAQPITVATYATIQRAREAARHLGIEYGCDYADEYPEDDDAEPETYDAMSDDAADRHTRWEESGRPMDGATDERESRYDDDNGGGPED